MFPLTSFVLVVNALAESLLLILVSVIVGYSLCTGAANAIKEERIENKTRAFKVIEHDFVLFFI
jgi:hypothetical protein